MLAIAHTVIAGYDRDMAYTAHADDDYHALSLTMAL